MVVGNLKCDLLMDFSRNSPNCIQVVQVGLFNWVTRQKESEKRDKLKVEIKISFIPQNSICPHPVTGILKGPGVENHPPTRI